MVSEAKNNQNILHHNLHLVAWEITRSCNLSCAHCRAAARYGSYEGELTTQECFHLVDDIAQAGKPIIILTGGEPLLRPDIFEVGHYAAGKGLRVVMGTNGTLITKEIATRLKDIPISRIAISLDFPDAGNQDKFRGQTGAYQSALAGIANAREAGIEIQINSTLTRMNVSYLDQLLDLALEVGAVAFHPFLLVPTGRGKGLESVELSPQEYETTLNWIYDKQQEIGNRIFFKPTDAPHYLRIMKQREKQASKIAPLPLAEVGAHGRSHPANAITRGCLAGISFCFISHRGTVQGCGYLDIEAGNIRTQPFGRIWADSPLFNHLRDLSNLKGKCGECEYKRVCGGCRARAYEASKDYLEAEPYCIYQPIKPSRGSTNVQP